jgi:diadenylate cyclase
LGRQNIVKNFLFTSQDIKDSDNEVTDRTINEIVRASFEMGKMKTGALMVMERSVALGEYERTGIAIDALLSSQLLINIFEHNTPLHDGAAIIRGNRIVCATCYLPLTERLDVGKEFGTRHRAALGISEVSDSITIVVSEETGAVSVAQEGHLYKDISREELTEKLQPLKKEEANVDVFKRWRDLWKTERETDKQ